MQKIFSVEQIRLADAYTIQHEPISSLDLMERAASRCFDWILARLSGKKPDFHIFCGPGNNGGDGLVLARLLFKANYYVHIAIPEDENKYSPDFQVNLKRLEELGVKPTSLREGMLNDLKEDDFIIDSLIGSGLSKPLNGLLEDVVRFINNQECIVISIDIPSGLIADKPTDIGDPVVSADYTLSFQLPKLAFMFAENDNRVGEWVILPIGLDGRMIDSESCNNYLVTLKGIACLLKPRRKFSHKGTFGHALLISGSFGKIGASVLASRACLHSGVGLLTTHLPKCGYQILQITVPEAMVSVDPNEEECSHLPELTAYSAIGAGPGIGTSTQARNLIKLLIQEAKVPLLLDADALNIVAEEKTWLAFLPAGSILTPHPKEFERLAGKSNNGFNLLDLLRKFCITNKVYVVLKGAHTITCTPSGSCFFNSTGNPGMSTAGSGDVLSGIITGLLAQSYSSLDACLLGVYLHGLAGDIAAQEVGKEALIAGDFVKYLGRAFLSISM